MSNINLDDGKKRFTINSDPSRCIEFNTNDYNILLRAKESESRINEALKDIPEDVNVPPDGSSDELNEAFVETLGKIDNTIREAIDYIFDAEVSNIVFGATSPLSSKNGVTYVERFMTAIRPILEKEVRAEAKASEERISKHTAKYQKKKG